jgi:hypothetical protein
VNTYFFTFEVKMDGKNYDRLCKLEDRAEKQMDVLPMWRAGKALEKWLWKKMKLDVKLVRYSYTGHKNNIPRL